MGIEEMKGRLFPSKNYVCGGHGARWPRDGRFVVPKGITIKFYVSDGDSLPNDVGQKVDQIVNGGTPPSATETITGGSQCWDYRLFYHKAGGYLNVAMSSTANERYIMNSNNDSGIHLSDICELVQGSTPYATIHWSACRAHEANDSTFGEDEPEYTGALAALASKAGKTTIV